MHVRDIKCECNSSFYKVRPALQHQHVHLYTAWYLAHQVTVDKMACIIILNLGLSHRTRPTVEIQVIQKRDKSY